MNEILFLGTAGGRFAVFNQIRHSGGIFLNLNETKVILDPGPGALIRYIENKISLKDIDGIILTHNHLDHSADVNVIIEGMTQGGTIKKGIIFAPNQCFQEKVILDYARNYVKECVYLNDQREFSIKNLKFSCLKHEHGSETYGIKFKSNIDGEEVKIGYITDTKFFDKILDFYSCQILIINVVLKAKQEKYLHLCVDDVIKINKTIKPKISLITHFGMQILKSNPKNIASEIEKETKIKTISCYDNMKISIDNLIDKNTEKQKSLLEF